MRLSLQSFDRSRARKTAVVTFIGLLAPLILSITTGNTVIAQFPILQVYLSPIFLIASAIGLKVNKDEPARSTWLGLLLGTAIAAIVGTCIFFWMLWTLGWLG